MKKKDTFQTFIHTMINDNFFWKMFNNLLRNDQECIAEIKIFALAKNDFSYDYFENNKKSLV